VAALELLPGEGEGIVVHADNLDVSHRIRDASVDLVYVDPPFNTGKDQRRIQLRTERSEDGDRIGFGGHRYLASEIGRASYADSFDDYLAFLEPRLREVQRMLAPTGSLYFHGDYREIHYCKVLLDGIFGRENFLNEIIWAYDYGGRSFKRWPAKHDNLLFYAKDRQRYLFNSADIDRVPYLAPGLAGPAKAARGKMPTDTWWMTIVSPTGKEKTGYPTQKPLALLKRIVTASSPPGGLVVDLFAGSGTTGAAALALGRRFLLVDSHHEAIDVMRRRFDGQPVRFEVLDGTEEAAG
jgi:site-specific DNA-methyltransferase (adenine-specific)